VKANFTPEGYKLREEIMIHFKKYEETAVLHSPLKDFATDSQLIEYREDPLTGFTCFIRTGRAFWAGIYKTDQALLEKLIEETRGKCFFCPEKVSTSTPKFAADFIQEGRIIRGEATLFPNLFAHKQYSGIIAMTQKHYLKLDEFNPIILTDAFKLADFYIRRAHEVSGVEYAEIGGNYLYPSGASIVHPHLQVIVSHGPHSLIKVYSEKGKVHYRKYSRNFWDELIDKEKRLGERYLGNIGSTEWFTPFAPIREDEVDAVVCWKSNFLEFEDHDWESLAQGLSRVLKAYHDKGFSCYNFAIYSGPLGKKLKHLWAGIKIISRSSVQTYPVSDTWYSSSILLDGFVVEPPEEIAKQMRPYFG
jgi:UDPglucose--hexose-1-phosphate uridylyltransferase